MFLTTDKNKIKVHFIFSFVLNLIKMAYSNLSQRMVQVPLMYARWLQEYLNEHLIQWLGICF